MSRLAAMQARFQQKQMQEKEEKLIKLYESQQQRAFDRVGARGSLSGGASPTAPVALAAPGAGKVRQMFDERRQKAGIDRSYPLEPLKNKNNGFTGNTTSRVPNITTRPIKSTSTSTFKSSVQRTITQSRNGKPPTTLGARATAEANFINGELKSSNVHYDVIDNSNPMDVLKNQEKQLEIMMKNHSIIDDEEFVDCSEFDDAGDFRLDNGKENGNRVSNGNNRKESPPQISPIKKITPKASYAAVKEKSRDTEKMKNPVVKTQASPTKANGTPNSRPTSSTSYHSKERSQMKSANTRQSTPIARSAVQPSRGTNGLSRQTISHSTQRDDLRACQYCQRRFANDRIQLHQEICARTLKKKRKTYDPIKHRVQGTDAEAYVKKGGKVAGNIKAKAPSISKQDWRRQHEEFISAIRAAKEAQAHVARGGKLCDLPPPPPSLNPDYVQCPHCNRRFNETAAARHIPKCASMLHNKPSRPGPPQKKK